MGFNRQNYDPRLIQLTTKKETAHEIDPTYEKLIDEYIESSGLGDDPQKNLLIPSNLRNAKIRNEIKAEAEAGIPELTTYLSRAIQSLVEDKIESIEPSEYEELLLSISEATNHLEAIDFSKEIDTNFQEILKMDDKVINTIFKIAQYQYENKKHEDSLSIFVLLTFLVPDDPDYLYRIGIIARKIEKLDFAVKAFEKTIQLKNDFTQAHLFLAECYEKLDRKKEAKQELELSKNEANFTDLSPDWKEMIAQLEESLN